MAHKAPLLGLINQGKCLAVTHSAVLSRGSVLITILSFMEGPCLFLPEPSGGRAATALLLHGGGGRLLFGASLWTGRDDDDDVDGPTSESKTGVCAACCCAALS